MWENLSFGPTLGQISRSYKPEICNVFRFVFEIVAVKWELLFKQVVQYSFVGSPTLAGDFVFDFFMLC